MNATADNPFSDAGGYSKFRSKFVGAIKQLRELSAPLKFLDEDQLSASEIVNAWIAAGGDKVQCERFRFDLACERQVLPPITQACS